MAEIEQTNYAEQAQGKAMALYRKVPDILYAKQGQSLRFVQQPVQAAADSLVYSLGNGRYRLTRDLYMIRQGQKNFLSLDAERWFLASAAANKQGNLLFRLDFTTISKTEDWLEIYYQAELVLAKQLEFVTFPARSLAAQALRPVVQGRSGDYLLRGAAKKKSRDLDLEVQQDRYDQLFQAATGVEIDLDAVILYFPKNYEFYYRILLLGNLMDGSTAGETTKVQFLKNIYFYYPSQFFASISFDGKDWSSYYFQFRIESFSSSIFGGLEELSYSDGVYLYKES